MITDSLQIQKAIETLLDEDFCLRIYSEDFDRFCPRPAFAIHIVADSAENVVASLKEELPQTSGMLYGLILALRGEKMTAGEMQCITEALPRADRFKRGVMFGKPAGGDYEIWLFASA